VSRNSAVIMSGGGSGTRALAAIIRSGMGEPGSTCFFRFGERSSMSVVSLVDDAQPLEGEELVNLLDAARLPSNQAREPADSDDPYREAQLARHALTDSGHHPYVPVDQPRFHRAHGCPSPHSLLW